MTISTPSTPSTTTHPATRVVDVQDLNQAWCDAFNARDIDALMATYEPDAVLVPGPGADPIVGLVAIEAALRGFLGLGGTVRFTPRYLFVSGDIAMGSIEFAMDGATDPTGAPIELRGITAEVLRRQPDGTWKYAVDHPFSDVA